MWVTLSTSRMQKVMDNHSDWWAAALCLVSKSRLWGIRPVVPGRQRQGRMDDSRVLRSTAHR